MSEIEINERKFIEKFVGTDLERLALACLDDSAVALANLRNGDSVEKIISLMLYAWRWPINYHECIEMMNIAIYDNSSEARLAAIVTLSSNKNPGFAVWIIRGLLELCQASDTDESMKREMWFTVINQAMAIGLSPPMFRGEIGNIDDDPAFVERLLVAIKGREWI